MVRLLSRLGGMRMRIPPKSLREGARRVISRVVLMISSSGMNLLMIRRIRSVAASGASVNPAVRRWRNLSIRSMETDSIRSEGRETFNCLPLNFSPTAVTSSKIFV